jgi:hypothetical protein
MNSHRKQLSRRVIPALLVALTVSLATVVPAQGQNFGRTGIEAPESTEAGEWTGSYFYISARKQIALWAKVENGKPQLKLRVDEGPRGDNFTVDWNGVGEYTRGGRKGRFELKIDEADANLIVGSWRWHISLAESTRTETANFRIYRSGYGRQMVWDITDLKREFTGKFRGPPQLDHVVWSFHKVSRGMASWAEFPF